MNIKYRVEESLLILCGRVVEVRGRGRVFLVRELGVLSWVPGVVHRGVRCAFFFHVLLAGELVVVHSRSLT